MIATMASFVCTQATEGRPHNFRTPMSRLKKSSKAQNQYVKMRQIANGMADSGPKKPVFVQKRGKIKKLSRAEFEQLEEESKSLSYFAGYPIYAEDLVK